MEILSLLRISWYWRIKYIHFCGDYQLDLWYSGYPFRRYNKILTTDIEKDARFLVQLKRYYRRLTSQLIQVFFFRKRFLLEICLTMWSSGHDQSVSIESFRRMSDNIWIIFLFRKWRSRSISDLKTFCWWSTWDWKFIWSYWRSIERIYIYIYIYFREIYDSHHYFLTISNSASRHHFLLISRTWTRYVIIIFIMTYFHNMWIRLHVTFAIHICQKSHSRE